MDEVDRRKNLNKIECDFRKAEIRVRNGESEHEILPAHICLATKSNTANPLLKWYQKIYFVNGSYDVKEEKNECYKKCSIEEVMKEKKEIANYRCIFCEMPGEKVYGDCGGSLNFQAATSFINKISVFDIEKNSISVEFQYFKSKINKSECQMLAKEAYYKYLNHENKNILEQKLNKNQSIEQDVQEANKSPQTGDIEKKPIEESEKRVKAESKKIEVKIEGYEDKKEITICEFNSDNIIKVDFANKKKSVKNNERRKK